jgi:large conductance mechanosensitive channel
MGEKEDLMIKDFRDFILRGNVVDLAVAVVIGAAFGAVVTSLVSDLITPLIAAIGGQPDFSALDFTLNSSTFRYGSFINALISFLVIAAAVFFLVVLPVNKLMERYKSKTPTEPTTRACPFCLSDIPMAARRCAFCTSEVAATA